MISYSVNVREYPWEERGGGLDQHLIAGSQNDSFLEPVACQSGSAAAAAWKSDQKATQGCQERGERNPSPPLHPRPSLCLCWLTPLLPSCPLPHASHAVPTVPNVVTQPSAAGPTVLSPFSITPGTNQLFGVLMVSSSRGTAALAHIPH